MSAGRIRKLDFILILVTVAIICLGVAAIYSAKKGGDFGLEFARRQIVWAIVGLILMIAASTVDHHFYTRFYKHIYFGNILLLLAVQIIGHSAKGAQRWIGYGPVKVQPSEFAKLALILTLAVYLAAREKDIREFGVLVRSFLHAAPAVLLVFIQPDLGTTLVLAVIWFGMSFIVGAQARHLALFALVGISLFTVAWHTNILKPYQKARLVAFINPRADPLGSGYHILQSRIAIGSGQITGKGYLRGTQNQLRFIPEQHTDFIFTVVGEEMGFVGAAALLALYAILVYRALALLVTVEDALGRLISGGVSCLLAFQIVVNIGMTLGVLPVTGIPLPLFSYGGSSLLTTLTAIGILQSVHARRHRIDF